MSKRICRKRAMELYNDTLVNQELDKIGVRPKVSRLDKKRRLRLSKYERFVNMLKERGGYFKQKEKRKELK